jgi:uncharacterized protein
MRPSVRCDDADSRMQTLPPWIRADANAVRLALRVQPGARRCALVGEYGERLKIAVQAPPSDGRANEALLDYLASCLNLRRGALRVVAGAASRDKSVLVDCDPSDAPRIAQRLMNAFRG